MKAQGSADGAPHPGARADCLFLAGGREGIDLADLLDRLGLSPNVATPVADARLSISLLDSRMALYDGAAALDLLTAHIDGPAATIGDAPSHLPEAGSLIAIELEASSFPSQAAHFAAVQQLCVAAVALGSAIGATRLFWPPAQLWSPFSALVDAVAALEDQGLPPVLHLVAMQQRQTEHGATRIISRGLAHFCGVEIALEYGPTFSGIDAVQRLARLVIHAMIAGPLHVGAVVAGIERGERLLVMARETGTPPVILVQLQTRLH
jgi:hypothetical protein